MHEVLSRFTHLSDVNDRAGRKTPENPSWSRHVEVARKLNGDVGFAKVNLLLMISYVAVSCVFALIHAIS